MTIPIFVISLVRATERRADIARRLDLLNINYEIVDAVDGATLDLSQYADRLVKSPFLQPLLPTEIGCYLSHYQLWERMLKEKIPYALILEDDSEWENDLPQVIADVAVCDWQWDVVMLQSHCRGISRILSPLGNRYLVQNIRESLGMYGYLVSLSGANKLVKYFYKIRSGIDYAWKPYWRWGGNVFAVQPKVVHHPHDESMMGYDTKPAVRWHERLGGSLIRKYDRLQQWRYFCFRRPRKTKL